MNRAVILLNGEPYLGQIDDKDAVVYCCDGAYEWAKGRVRIDETLGDFDSLEYLPDPPPKEIYPSEKNFTDGEIALFRAVEAGAEYIQIYGGGGGREDHFIGNLHLLLAAKKRGSYAEMITAHARIFLGEGEVRLCGCKGKTVSIVPFGGDAHIMESEGLKYPLDRLTLEYGTARGISNVVTEDEARFVAASGRVLVFVDENE